MFYLTMKQQPLYHSIALSLQYEPQLERHPSVQRSTGLNYGTVLIGELKLKRQIW